MNRGAVPLHVGHPDLLPVSGRPPVAMVAACPFPAGRGTPIRIEQMAEALQDAGFDVHVVAYHLGTDRPLPPGVRLHRIPAVSFYQDFSAGPKYRKIMVLDPMLAVRLARIVRRYRIRVVHAHHFEGAMCALMVKRFVGGFQVVYDAHTSLQDEILDYQFHAPRIVKKIAADLLDSLVPRLCDHVVTVSDELRRFVVDRGVAPQNVSVIPMGVNTGGFLSCPRSEARQRLGLSAAPVVLYTGNLAPFQGVDRLIRAMPSVAGRIADSRLVIVSEATPAYERKAAETGLADRISFTGELPFEQVRLWLAAADVVVLPRSNCPGFPLKLLNYMAAGKAIVAFAGGGREVLQHLRNGYLAPDGNEQALADGIVRCLQDPELRDRIGEAAMVTAKDFELDALRERVLRLYGGLLPQGAPRDSE